MEMQNARALTPPIRPRVGPFHERPFQVPHADRFGEALEAAIECRRCARSPAVWAPVWQFAHSTDVLDYVPRPGTLAAVSGAG
jgi:hypothetical protein